MPTRSSTTPRLTSSALRRAGRHAPQPGPIDPAHFEADVAAAHDGGVFVSTTAFIAAPGDESRGVRATTVFVRPSHDRLKQLVALVDAIDLMVEVTRRIFLAELPALHAKAKAALIASKVGVLPWKPWKYGDFGGLSGTAGRATPKPTSNLTAKVPFGSAVPIEPSSRSMRSSGRRTTYGRRDHRPLPV